KTEAGAVYGEYRKNRANPFFTLFEAVHGEAFEAHTYGHTAMGYVEDIQRMPELFDFSLTFFDRYYRPDNTILLIAGDVEVAPTLELVRRYYGGWKQGYVAPEIPEEPAQTAEKRIEVPYPGASLPIVWIGYKAEAFDPESRRIVAADLLCDLAFGETSDLHKKLVLDEQVVEFVNASTNINRDPGLTNIITRVKDPARVDYVIAEIDSALERFRGTAPEEKALSDLKSRRKYGFLMALDTPSSVARGLSRWLAVNTTLDSVDAYFRTLEAVTPEDIRAAAEAYFLTDRRTVAVLKGAQ
ncbi:MAG: insulinase family protein, partial [Holophagales bacterium]|nr:insulinase family protein [Holophagales bacterium]